MDSPISELRRTRAAVKAAEAVIPGNELQRAAAADLIVVAVALDTQEQELPVSAIDLHSPAAE